VTLELTGSELESRVLVAVMAALATGWLILGPNSDSVPWGSDTIWMIVCALAAGAALAVARYRTLFALRSYVVITALIGAARSFAYLSDNAGGPAAVWFILTVTTIGGYLEYTDKLQARRRKNV